VCARARARARKCVRINKYWSCPGMLSLILEYFLIAQYASEENIRKLFSQWGIDFLLLRQCRRKPLTQRCQIVGRETPHHLMRNHTFVRTEALTGVERTRTCHHVIVDLTSDGGRSHVPRSGISASKLIVTLKNALVWTAKCVYREVELESARELEFVMQFSVRIVADWMGDRIIGSGNDIAVSIKHNQYSKVMKRYDNATTRSKFKCFIERVRVKMHGGVLYSKKNNNPNCRCAGH